jgi:hypothetical protein
LRFNPAEESVVNSLRIALRSLLLLPALGLLTFNLGCGGSGGNKFTNPGGTFTASSLQGQYAFQVGGIDSVGFFQEAGVFAADGNGNITSGTEDLVRSSGLVSSPITGSYSLSNDGSGTGFLTLNSAGRSLELAMTMVTTSKIYLVVSAESLTTAIATNGGGVALKQTTAALSNPPAGTFAFRIHTTNPNQGSAASRVGAMNIAAGTITGNVDVNQDGSPSQLTLGGLFNFPDSTGRGTVNLTDSSPSTLTFLYYIVDTSHFLLLGTDTGFLDAGEAELQSGGPFSIGSLSGSYAFGARGDSSTNFTGANAVGRFAADGNGNITAGAFDSSEDGNASSNVSFTGTVTNASASGRFTLNLDQNIGGSGNVIVWMASPTRGFFLIDSASTVEDGSMDAQQLSSFTDASMHGQFALVMDGFDLSIVGAATPFVDRVGTISWDGNGGLTLNEFVNSGGVTNTPGLLSGTYVTHANGRITGTLSGISNAMVLYAVTPTDAYFLLNDSGVVVSGHTTKQVGP